MPAAVVVLNQEAEARAALLAAMRAAGHEAVGFDDPVKALDAIEIGCRARVLVTRVSFSGPGKLNGVALARVLRYNKRRPVKVVFAGQPKNRRHIDEEDEFVPRSSDPTAVVEVVSRLLASSW